MSKPFYFLLPADNLLNIFHPFFRKSDIGNESRKAFFNNKFLFTILIIFCFRSNAASKLSGVKVPFELVDNRVFIEVILNGKGPFKMILDSNSSSLTVSPGVARKLDLTLRNPTACGGAGAGKEVCYDTRLESASVNGVKTLVDQVSVVPVKTIIEIMGPLQIDGVIGVQFFQENIIELNFEKKIMTLFSREMDFSKAGMLFPLEPDQDYPDFLAMRALVDGKQGLFSIDTGDRSNLTVFQSFSNQFHLRNSYSKIISTITGQGINGPIRADVLKLRHFKLMDLDFLQMPVRLPELKDFSSKKMSGSIGTGVLKTMNLIFDYPHKRLILLGKSGIDFQNFDRSGLWVLFKGDVFMIQNVINNSPASFAKLKRKDLILEVEGEEISKIGLSQLRETLSQHFKKTVTLKVKRGVSVKSYNLNLFDLI